MAETLFTKLKLLFFSFKFIDFDLTDDDTCKATIRMFLQCNLVQQFQIPYHVRMRIVVNNSLVYTFKILD